MENFLSLLCFMGGACDDYLVDVIGKLPPEIANMVLRKLDPASLLSAALVSKRWLALVRSDRVLRKDVLSQLKKQKKKRSRALKFSCRILRGGAPAKPFEDRNERFEMQMPKISAELIQLPPKKLVKPVIVREMTADRSKCYEIKVQPGAPPYVLDSRTTTPVQSSNKRKFLQRCRRRLLRV